MLAGAPDHQEVVLEATNRRGKKISLRVNTMPLRLRSKEIDGIKGIISMMEYDEIEQAG